MHTPLLIEANNISLVRDDRTILEDVNFKVRQDDFVVITGPNGGGKTTLLRIILSLQAATGGTLTFPEGRPLTGYLPQKSSVDPQFPISVGEVVKSGLFGIKGMKARESAQLASEALAMVEMDHLHNRPIGRLSGGQLQRVLFARAIVGHPKLLILDEPLSYIDRHFTQRFYELLEISSRSATILMVSHDLTVINEMATQRFIVDRRLTIE